MDVLTTEQARTLRAAETVLREIAKRTYNTHGLNDSDTWSMGILHADADRAREAIFSVFNTANSHLDDYRAKVAIQGEI